MPQLRSRNSGTSNSNALPATPTPRWSRFVRSLPDDERTRSGTYVIGVLRGEGIGPEVVGATLAVLAAVETASPDARFKVRNGGPIGNEAVRERGQALSPEVSGFCREVFAEGGAILAGAGGDRFVYEMRREFDLYCKISPLVTRPELQGAGCLKPEHTANIDILVVRESMGGVYQGQWEETIDDREGRVAHHRFAYSESQVRRIMKVAAAIARERRGELTVVVKPSGVPAISRLWSDCARDIAREFGIQVRELEIDYAAFRLIHEPRTLDVIVTPNLFGDVISDVGGVLLGSRGLCYGGNFSASGAAVYQTNHGAAYDLAGNDHANPVGQIFSLAMLLRESFGLDREASLIENAVAAVWRLGLRTADICEEGCRIVGTREMGRRIAEAAVRLARSGD